MNKDKKITAFRMKRSTKKVKILATLTALSLVSTIFSLPFDVDPGNNSLPSPANTKTTNIDLAKIPVPFIKNIGQYSEEIAFLGQIQHGSVAINKTGKLTYGLITQADTQEKNVYSFEEEFQTPKKITPSGGQPSSVNINHYEGNNKSRWDKGIPAFTSIEMGEVFEGITMTLRANNKNIEKIFTLNPEAKVENIKIKVNSIKELRIDQTGQLLTITPKGMLVFSKPLAYQELNGQKTVINTSYRLIDETTYGFQTGPYDKSKPLIIDPFVIATYFGTEGADEPGTFINTDQHGNVILLSHYYVSVTTSISNTHKYYTGTYSPTARGILIAKFTQDLSELLSYTEILILNTPGTLVDMAVDKDGNVFIGGITPAAGTTFYVPLTDGTNGTIAGFDHTYDFTDATTANVPYIIKLNNNLELVSSTLVAIRKKNASNLIGASNYYLKLALDNSSPQRVGFISNHKGVTSPNTIVADKFPITSVPCSSPSPACDESGVYFSDTTKLVSFVGIMDNNLSQMLKSTLIDRDHAGEIRKAGKSIAFDSSNNLLLSSLIISLSSSAASTPNIDCTYSTCAVGFTAGTMLTKLSPDLGPTSLLKTVILNNTGVDNFNILKTDQSSNLYFFTSSTSSSLFTQAMCGSVSNLQLIVTRVDSSLNFGTGDKRCVAIPGTISGNEIQDLLVTTDSVYTLAYLYGNTTGLPFTKDSMFLKPFTPTNQAYWIAKYPLNLSSFQNSTFIPYQIGLYNLNLGNQLAQNNNFIYHAAFKYSDTIRPSFPPGGYDYNGALQTPYHLGNWQAVIAGISKGLNAGPITGLTATYTPTPTPSLNLTWDIATNSTSGYKVYYGTSGTCSLTPPTFSGCQSVTTSTNSRTLSGLTAGATYNISVVALNTAGEGEPGSITVIAGYFPSAITDLTAYTNASISGQIKLNWTPPPEPILGYHIYYKKYYDLTYTLCDSVTCPYLNPSPSCVSDCWKYAITGLTNGILYDIIVKSVNANGESPAQIPSPLVAKPIGPSGPSAPCTTAGTETTISFCGLQEIENKVISFTGIPASFSFPSISVSTTAQPVFNNSLISSQPDSDDILGVLDNRNSGGFEVQLQASTPFTNGTSDIPLANLFVNTSIFGPTTTISNTDPAVACPQTDCGVIYSTGIGTKGISAPLDSQGASLGQPSSFTTNLGGVSPLVLMNGSLPSSQGRNGRLYQFINFYLSVPALQQQGDYEVVLTYTLLDSTT